MVGLPACEEGPARYDIGDDVNLCGPTYSDEHDLQCADPIVAGVGAAGERAETLVTLDLAGMLVVTEVLGDELGEEILRTPVSTGAALGSPLVSCDIDGNGTSEIVASDAANAAPFLVWNQRLPGSGPAPNVLPWEVASPIVCGDLDDDGFDDLIGFSVEGDLQVVWGEPDGYDKATSQWRLSGYDGFFPPNIAAVRPPRCEAAIVVTRAIQIAGDMQTARAADVFELDQELVPQEPMRFEDADVVSPFLRADSEGVLLLLWVLVDERYELRLYYTSGPCSTDFEPTLVVELGDAVGGVWVDENRGLVSILHADRGDVSVFAWERDSFTLTHEISGPAVRPAFLGSPLNERVAVLRPIPPFVEIEPLSRPN